MKKIFYSLFILLALGSKAQVMSYDFYSFRANNMFNVNPAYTGRDVNTGKEEGLHAILSAQTQNKGVSYANKNYMFGIHSPISSKQGLGIKVISDSRGAFQLLKADISYAYIAKISEYSKFSLGLSGGILNNSLLVNRIENYQSLDQSDPTLTKSYYNTNQFAAGVGFLYTFKGLDVSFSMPHIITTNQALNGYINACVFYKIEASEDLDITPWICYQNIPTTKDVSSLFLKATYKDIIWIQPGFQTNKSFCAMFGVNIEKISIGYGYKTSNNDFKAVTSGLHEITLRLNITGPGIPHIF